MATAKKSAPAKSAPTKPAAPAPKANLPVAASGGAMIVDEVPDYLKNQQSARGSENVGMDDMAIPRLEIVQGLSPALKRGDPGYIEGARMGDLINSVSRQVYGEQVFVVPAFFAKQFLVWKDQDKGGGFFGAYPNAIEAKERADAEGGEAAFIQVVDTPQHVCLVIDSNTGRAEEIIIPMPRTKAKISRQWNSMVKLMGGDRFGRVYRIGTALEKNEKGDFYNFTVAPSGYPRKDVYQKAEKLWNALQTGERKVVMNVEGLDPGEGHVIEDGEM